MRNNFENFQLLLERLKERDLAAFDYLYKKVRDRLYVYAYFIVKDETVAQDLVQELFIDFWERKLFQNIDSSLIPYLMRSIRNRCYDYLNKQLTHQKLKDQFEYLVSENLTTFYTLENIEFGKKLNDTIALLPPMQGKVFYLHYIQGLSHAKIAEQLNISKSTVSNHMDKALKMLRAKLK